MRMATDLRKLLEVKNLLRATHLRGSSFLFLSCLLSVIPDWTASFFGASWGSLDTQLTNN